MIEMNRIFFMNFSLPRIIDKKEKSEKTIRKEETLYF